MTTTRSTRSAWSLAGVAMAILIALLMMLDVPAAAPATAASDGGSIWGADYFPDVPLTTQDGKTVRFFTDLIKGKVVAINFIYTSCPSACALETARMREVQKILGDRVGSDVFFYSITIDPEHDTPQVLKQYAGKFKVGPGWLFLTGKADDITQLRKKLGLYGDEDESKNLQDHNLSHILGNQSTGQWMKASPYENPYIMAQQLGGWLHSWKQASRTKNDYANAPQVREISKGEDLFRGRCSACHTIGETDAAAAKQRLGPDLLGVTKKRDRAWLTRWLAEPDKMLAEKDPVATAMLAEYNNLAMPNLGMTEVEIQPLLAYIESESERVERLKQALVH